MANNHQVDVLIVTGMSGAGKSTALNALEDLGYYCVDNLPPGVIDETLKALKTAGSTRIALGIDVRLRAFLEGAPQILRSLINKSSYKISVLYLDASEELLARRFSTTRRPHPLSSHPSTVGRELQQGVRLERKLLAPLRAMASVLIETSNLSVHELRAAVLRTFGEASQQQRGLFVRLLSFGFKYGPPMDADMMLDVRFLPNPYFVEELRPLSGKDEDVRKYVFESPVTNELVDHAFKLLAFCIPRFEDEGKSYVTVGVGCTGGRHRSVAVTERLATLLSEALGFTVNAVHRDIVRESQPSSEL